LKPDLELVIARHQEDLRWVRRVPPSFRVTIYNKGGKEAIPSGFPIRDGMTVLNLPNIGREAHTYLTHLCNRYESLAATTVFCQGHPFDHAPDFHDSLVGLENSKGGASPFLWYGFLDESDDPLGRRLFVPWSKNPERRELATGRLFEELFRSPSPPMFYFRGGAQFAVERGAVLRNSLDFYRNALWLADSVPDAAHSYERLWDRLFGAPLIDPSTLGPDGVRYRKKIRCLEISEQGR
jgi:hypothetical protein